MQQAKINPESRTSIHFGLGYVVAMQWAPDRTMAVNFQKALLDNGLDFSQTNIGDNSFTLVRRQQSHLQAKIEAAAPQLVNVQIFSQNPAYDLDMFVRDCAAVMAAYQQTFPVGQYQIIRTSAKVQHLYSCDAHPFQYLWEVRLGQSPEDFRSLGGRPVAGGGLRLLLPPYAKEGEQLRSTEIRIEAFLHEPGKILVETGFTWPQPKLLKEGEKFDPQAYLKALEQYATNEVLAFLMQNKHI